MTSNLQAGWAVGAEALRPGASRVRRGGRSAGLCGAALVLSTLWATPAHAGLFDALNDLKNKITDSKAKVDEEQDAAYEAELAKKFPPYRFDAAAAQQSAQHVELVRGSNFKDVKKVGIVNFSVEFALFKEVSASGGSQYRGGTARDANKSMQIPSPDVARLQAMVDQLHAQTAKDFAAMGIEVVPFETLKATQNFAELAPAQHASPWATDTKDTQSVFIAPTGMPLYMDNPARADFLKGLGFTFGTNTRLKEVMMTFELGREVHLLSVNMVVDFAAMKSSGRSFISYASVSGGNLHHLHAGNTSYRFIGPGQPELLYAKLKQPVVSDTRLIAETSKTASQASTQTFDAVGTAVETTRTDTTSRGADAFDIDTYYKRSADMLDATRQMFAAELGKVK
jgi:hypothetical protein